MAIDYQALSSDEVAAIATATRREVAFTAARDALIASVYRGRIDRLLDEATTASETSELTALKVDAQADEDAKAANAAVKVAAADVAEADLAADQTAWLVTYRAQLEREHVSQTVKADEPDSAVNLRVIEAAWNETTSRMGD